MRELPAGLGDLLHLKALYLGTAFRPTEAGELKWSRGRKLHLNLTDLSRLAGLQELQRLGLQACEGVTDLSPLAGLQELQSLDLAVCTDLKDLSPLAGLQQLQSLDFSFTGVTDLRPLASLQGL